MKSDPLAMCTPASSMVRHGLALSLRGVPVNFIIDREGVITASWYGFGKDDPRARDALWKLGIE